MKWDDLEKSLKQQVEAETPDVLDSILSRCGEQAPVTPISDVREENKKKTAKKPWVPVLATAAALAVVVLGAFGFNSYSAARAVDTVVSLDVNPAVEISANVSEKVLSVKAVNDDAKSLLEGSSFEGETLEDATEDIILLLTGEGYISQDANSVLLTVANSDSDKAGDIEQRLTLRIMGTLESQGVEGCVLGQIITGSEAEASASAGVTVGKEALVKKLAELSPELDEDELEDMPVNDLSVLADAYAGSDGVSGIVKVGNTSEGRYIGVEAAVDASGTELGINALDILNAKAKVGVENGKLVYNVSLETSTGKVSVIIDAVTGTIMDSLSSALGGEGDSDDDDSNNDSDDKTDSSGVQDSNTSGGTGNNKTDIGAIIGGIISGGTTNGGVTNGGVTDGGVTNGGVTDGGVTDGGDNAPTYTQPPKAEETPVPSAGIGDEISEEIKEGLEEGVEEILEEVGDILGNLLP